MQSTSLRALQTDLPHLGRAFDAIEESLKRSPSRRFVEVRSLANENKSISTSELAAALGELTSRGIFRRGYRVRTATGKYLPESFHELIEIPTEIKDDYDQKVNIDDCVVIMVYEAV